jgi:hypothetical protein
MSGMTEGEVFAKVIGQRKEDVLGDEVVFRLGTDSSAWPQNDNVSGNELRDGEDLGAGYGWSWV